MRKLLAHKVVQGTLWYSVVGILTSGISLILLPIMTRWMSPKEFGILNSAVALSQLIMPFVTIGLGSAVIRYYHEYKSEESRFRRFFSAAFWFQTIASLFVVGVLIAYFCYTELLLGVDFYHIIPILIIVLVNPPRDLGNHMLTAVEDHSRSSKNQLIAFVVGVALSLVLMGWADLGALGRLYGRAAGAIVAMLMLFWLPEFRSNLSYCVDRIELKKALQFGAPYIPYTLALAGMLTVDKLLLQYYGEMDEVGIYSASKTVAVGVSFVFVAVTKSWYPRYVALREENKEIAILRGQWSVLCLLSLSVVGFTLTAPVVFPYIVDERYWGGVEVLPVLAIATYCYGLFLVQANYVNFLKKTLSLPIIAGSGVLLNFLMCKELVSELGMSGAAYANFGGYGLMVIMLIVYGYFLEGRLGERIIQPCVSILASIIGVYLIMGMTDSLGIIDRIFYCGIICIAYYCIWKLGMMIMNRSTDNCEA
ncbi:lipopolysaccharide biosynthesis protein [Rubritalea tangerina]|uniref:Lipopolysaccharide biosynthesis protein n=1 Tax=Rubritalea tangerina TaxID=430798 RepID=A0ABW4ZAJ5_9BACT